MELAARFIFVRRALSFAFPVMAILAHTALVIVTRISIGTSNDPLAVMGWLLFDVIDWPVSLLFGNDAGFVLMIMLLGGMQWLVIGIVFQLIFNLVFRRLFLASGTNFPTTRK